MKLIRFFAILVLLPLSISAVETVILKNRKILKGNVNAQTGTTLTFTTAAGEKFLISKQEILKVVYKDLTENEAQKIIQEEEIKSKPKETKGKETFKDVKKDDKKEVRSKWSIVWRSAVLPGWGQWKAGKRWYGVISFLAVGGAIAYSEEETSKFHSKQNDYNSKSLFIGVITFGQNSPLSSQSFLAKAVINLVFNTSLYNPVDAQAKKGNEAYQALAVVYGLQLIHSYIIGRNWEKETVTFINGKPVTEGFNFYTATRGTQNSGLGADRYYEVYYALQF